MKYKLYSYVEVDEDGHEDKEQVDEFIDEQIEFWCKEHKLNKKDVKKIDEEYDIKDQDLMMIKVKFMLEINTKDIQAWCEEHKIDRKDIRN